MGIYVNLEIMPAFIDSALWRETYDESLLLLKAYTPPLMCLQVENLRFAKRLFYSSRLEQTTAGGQKYWEVVGDLGTKTSGETFRLYGNISDYQDSEEITPKEDIDILLRKEDSKLIRSIFHAKTQGLPYHIPLIAVAALIESRMPRYAFVRGNITKSQAKEAVGWANSILKKKIESPICLEATRLWQCLSKSLVGEELLNRFTDLFLGDKEEAYRLIWSSLSDKEIMKNWIIKKLRDYDVPTKIGCHWIFIAWLNATSDLRTLIELSSVRKSGPLFSPIDMAEALTNIWITIPQKDTKYLAELQEAMENTTTVESQLAQFALVYYTTGVKRKL
ncbi:MAG: hypothetical protein AABY26_01640 [Nanoarchaeota archaeon]